MRRHEPLGLALCRSVLAVLLLSTSAGMDWTFAPTIAVVRDDRWGRTYESYSEDPNIASGYVEALKAGRWMRNRRGAERSHSCGLLRARRIGTYC